MNSGIYAIKNKIDGKLYIGQTVNFARRFSHHRWSLRSGKHSSPKLQNAWNKYGESAFEFLILLESPVTELTLLEQQCFDSLKPVYNIAPAAGSNAGHRYPPEFGQKISAMLRGKKKPPRTPEHTEKIALARRGRPISAEHLEAMVSATTGKPKSRATRQRMVEAQKKRRLADGTLRMLTFDGQTRTLTEWAEALGMDRKLLDLRLWRGWTPERAFTTPVDLKYLGKSTV